MFMEDVIIHIKNLIEKIRFQGLLKFIHVGHITLLLVRRIKEDEATGYKKSSNSWKMK